jgi:hypothetical protein
MDTAKVGAHDKENGRRISLDMEGNIENGGLLFKETVMIGLLDETGELLKVLGTERNEIFVDFKINYDEKKKGTFGEDCTDLRCPEANLPDRITQGVLWRVA